MFGLKSVLPSRPNLTGERVRVLLLAPEKAELMQRFRIDNRAHLEPWEPERSRAFFTEVFWRAQLAAQIKDFDAGQSCCMTLMNADATRVLGVMNFTQIARGTVQSCHLGYALGHAFEGQGLMREGLVLGLEFIFNQLKLNRVMASYLPRNDRSGALLKRLGFEIEGKARAYLKINGVWEDHILTSKLNPEFERSLKGQHKPHEI